MNKKFYNFHDVLRKYKPFMDDKQMSAFDVSTILAVIFDMTKEEALEKIIKIRSNEELEYNPIKKMIRIDEKFILQKAEEMQLLLADGFNDCILGIAYGAGSCPRIVYDRNAVVEKIESQGMSHEEAVEFFDFNIEGAYVGKNTPWFVETRGEE